MVSSLSAGWTCQQCQKRQRGAKVQTMTGRTVCSTCNRLQTSAGMGMLTGEGTGEQVRGAIVIDTIRRWMRRDKA